VIGRAWGRLGGIWRRIFTVLVILAVARVAFGVFAIFLLDDYGLAWGLEATIIFATLVILGVLAMLVLRWTYHPAGDD
jgi:hypothetical protein